jgi:multisubunit Na+/H+ antiporter MnhB subunit
MFLGIALAGLYRVGVFFNNFLVDNSIMSPFELVSAGTIPVCNIAIALKVGMSLFMVFTILAAVRVAITVDDRSRKEDN